MTAPKNIAEEQVVGIAVVHMLSFTAIPRLFKGGGAMSWTVPTRFKIGNKRVYTTAPRYMYCLLAWPRQK